MVKNVKHLIGNVRWSLKTPSVAEAQNINSNAHSYEKNALEILSFLFFHLCKNLKIVFKPNHALFCIKMYKFHHQEKT